MSPSSPDYSEWEPLTVEVDFDARPSNSQLKKAGTILSKNFDSTDDDHQSALSILNHWRGLHLPLLRSFMLNLTKLDIEEAIPVSRIKRVASILAKLQRPNRPALNRLEDIAGARIIAPSFDNVLEVKEALSGIDSEFIPSSRPTRDYMYPESHDTGYRGIHVIYQYNGKETCFKNLHIELQIRSKIQHAWATAVEIIDTFTGQTLKAGTGDPEWQNFFLLVSNAFASIEIEDYQLEKKDYEGLRKLCSKLDILNRLRAFSQLIKQKKEFGKEEDPSYFILSLDSDEKSIHLYSFSQEEVNDAQKHYEYLEIENRANYNVDVVLVSSSSLDDLKSAYPNYFADTNHFIETLTQFLV
jgi:ppGpp synthetase/RelA/SpoT-type nucleotidyltranferase